MKKNKKIASCISFLGITLMVYQIPCTAKTDNKQINNLSIEGRATLQGDVTIAGKTTLNNELHINDGILSFASTKKVGKKSSFTIQNNQIQNNAHIKGQKTIHARKTNSPIFTILFNEFLEESSTAYYGAYLNLKIIVGGTISEDPTEIIYEGSLSILPAASEESPSTFTLLNENSTQVNGETSCTLSSAVSGNGKTAEVSLNSAPNIDNQILSIYYEIVSENIASIN